MERKREFSEGAFSEAEKSEVTYGVHCVLKDRLSRGILSTVRATAVRWNAEQNVIIAGDQMMRLLYNSNLNISVPSRGSEKARIRICLQVWSNIEGNRYKK